MSKPCILYVDDELKNGKYFLKFMKRENFDVEYVSTVEEAKIRIDKQGDSYDAIVSDYQFDNNMDGLTGLDVLEHACNINAYKLIVTAIIGVTNKTSTYPVLHKPLDFPFLAKKIRCCLNNR